MKLKPFLFAFGVIAIILTLLPLIAVDYWWIRIFDFPHLQLTGLTLAAIVFFFLKIDLQSDKDYIFITLLCLCFAFQFAKAYPYTPFSSKDIYASTENSDSAQLSILVANVYQKNKKPQEVLDLIAKKNPDVIFLLETNRRWKEAVHSTLTNTYPHQLLEPLDNTYGLLFYSKLPLEDGQIRHLVENDIPSIKGKLVLDNGSKVQLYGIHPTPPMPQHNPKSSDRDTEMMLIAFEARSNKLPTMVIGDFNDVAWSNTTQLFKAVSGLLDPRIGRGFYNTFSANNVLLRWPLDHIFVSPEFRIHTLERGADINSDHFPAFTILTFEPNKQKEQLPQEPSKEQLAEAKNQLKEQNLKTQIDDLSQILP